MSDVIERSQIHATFVIERTHPVPVEAVWHALSDNDARDQWFTAGEAFQAREKSHEFWVGGHSTEAGQWHGGPRSTFVSTYTDIVDLQRIVFTYDMWVDERHLSTSVTTIALENDGSQTRLTYTEQGVHFDGLDRPEGREEGTRGLLDQLGSYLAPGRGGTAVPFPERKAEHSNDDRGSANVGLGGRLLCRAKAHRYADLARMRLLGPELGLDDKEGIELTPPGSSPPQTSHTSATSSPAGARSLSITEDETKNPPPRERGIGREHPVPRCRPAVGGLLSPARQQLWSGG